VPETGIYTFYLKSDDGSKLYLDGELLIDNDGSHDTSTKTGLKALKKGMHPVRLDYFEDFLGAHLQLHFSGPTVGKSPAVFWHELLESVSKVVCELEKNRILYPNFMFCSFFASPKKRAKKR